MHRYVLDIISYCYHNNNNNNNTQTISNAP